MPDPRKLCRYIAEYHANGGAFDLQEAIHVATEAHRGQVDKAGHPYILHPLRVMLAMPDDAHRIVAVLHDVVEDTPVTFGDLLQAGLGIELLCALEALTRQRDEVYRDFVARAAENPVARVVKIADLRDNLSPARLAQLPPHERGVARRYEEALASLGVTP